MITDERKGELLADLEYSVNRYIDKKCIVESAIEELTDDPEEKSFLISTNSYFAVMLPKGE